MRVLLAGSEEFLKGNVVIRPPNAGSSKDRIAGGEFSQEDSPFGFVGALRLQL